MKDISCQVKDTLLPWQQINLFTQQIVVQCLLNTNIFLAPGDTAENKTNENSWLQKLTFVGTESLKG